MGMLYELEAWDVSEPKPALEMEIDMPTSKYFKAGHRLALMQAASGLDLYEGYNPCNNSPCAEGTWDEWVDLAKQIIAENNKRISDRIENGGIAT